MKRIHAISFFLIISSSFIVHAMERLSNKQIKQINTIEQLICENKPSNLPIYFDRPKFLQNARNLPQSVKNVLLSMTRNQVIYFTNKTAVEDIYHKNNPTIYRIKQFADLAKYLPIVVSGLQVYHYFTLPSCESFDDAKEACDKFNMFAKAALYISVLFSYQLIKAPLFHLSSPRPDLINAQEIETYLKQKLFED